MGWFHSGRQPVDLIDRLEGETGVEIEDEEGGIELGNPWWCRRCGARNDKVRGYYKKKW
jgi:hypothetical protein